MKTFHQWIEAKIPQPPCEKCKKGPRIKDERFCKGCRKALMDKMIYSGYLQQTRRHGDNRTKDHKEVIRDTKYGGNHSDY